MLPRNDRSFIFESQLVPFAFSLILGDPFMVSLSFPLNYGTGGLFSKKNAFYWRTNFAGKIYREIVLHAGTNDQWKGVSQMHFPVI